jgi:hypothetical protein
LISDPAPPSKVASVGDPLTSATFLDSANSVCPEWASTVANYDDNIRDWLTVDAKIPANQWTPEEKAINDAVAPFMSSNADELERLGRQSGNPTLEDIAILAAQYRRAYVAALPTYTSPDGFLAQSASYLVKTVEWACKAAG